MSGHPDPARWAAFEAAEGDERRALVAHLGACARCRAMLVESQPEALFALLGLAEIPVEALERVSRGVSVAIDRRSVSRSGWPRIASLAASLLLAALLSLPLLRDAAPVEWARGDAAPSPTVLREVSHPAPALIRGIELLSSPGRAEVVDFVIGDAQVVMIFDAELDI